MNTFPCSWISDEYRSVTPNLWKPPKRPGESDTGCDNVLHKSGLNARASPSYKFYIPTAITINRKQAGSLHQERGARQYWRNPEVIPTSRLCLERLSIRSTSWTASPPVTAATSASLDATALPTTPASWTGWSASLDWLGGRPVHWFVWQICMLTSWLTRVFWKLDGGTTRTQSFTGPLDRTASGLVYRLLVAQFNPVAGHLPELLEAAADQLLLHRFTITVKTGSLFKWRRCLACTSLLLHQPTSSFRSSDSCSLYSPMWFHTRPATIAASRALERSCTAWSCSRFSAEHAEAVIFICVA